MAQWTICGAFCLSVMQDVPFYCYALDWIPIYMRPTFIRLLWSCRYYGLSITGLTIFARLASRMGWQFGKTPGFLAFKDRAIDRRFRISTVGVVLPDEMDVDTERREHAIQYQPTASLDLAIVLDELADQVNLNDYSFVDFGSGKGRVILLASEFPFRSVTGVEFSAELHDSATHNINSFSSPRQQCKEVTSLCLDAAEFPVPDGPVVLFFFNPFDDIVMSRVLSNIEASLAIAPRPVVCIYHNPVHRHLLDDSSFWKEQTGFSVEHKQWAVYSGGDSQQSVNPEPAIQLQITVPC